MRKVLFFLLIAFTAISCGKATKSEQATPAISQNAQDAVEVIYFHGKQRCATCNAIENETKQLIDSLFADKIAEGALVFKIVDFSQKENEPLADKYEVTWSSLFVNDYVNGEEISSNLTEFAFANARSNPDNFKAELQRVINEALAN